MRATPWRQWALVSRDTEGVGDPLVTPPTPPDPDLAVPKLWLGPKQPLPVPVGTNVSVVCKGPPQPGTFWLYRGGPGERVGEQWVEGGGNATFTLHPLHRNDAYFCAYSPKSGVFSGPSSALLLLVEGERGTPKFGGGKEGESQIRGGAGGGY